jgi:hypothetical protein
MIIYGTAPCRFLPFIHTEFYKYTNAYRLNQFSVSCIIKEEPRKWYTPKTPFDWCWSLTEEEKNIIGYTDIDIHYNSFDDVYNNLTQLEHIDGKNYVVINDDIRSKSDLLCGVMDIEQLKKEKDDFIFTTMVHPVNRVYEAYLFIKSIATRSTLKRLTQTDVHLFGTGMDILIDDTKPVSETNLISIERFVDLFIEKKGIFKLKNNLFMNDCNFLQTEIINGNHDYICFFDTATDIIRSLTFLNKKLKMDFTFTKFNLLSNQIKENIRINTYRRADLEKLFVDEIETYMALKKKYIACTY